MTQVSKEKCVFLPEEQIPQARCALMQHGNLAEQICSSLSLTLRFMIWDQDIIALTLMLQLGMPSSANVLNVDGTLDF